MGKKPDEWDPGRWKDDQFLDTLRRQGDELADECYNNLHSRLHSKEFNALFTILLSDNQPLPPNTPDGLKEFFQTTTRLPTLNGNPLDLDRIRRGGRVFLTRAFPCALVLLTKSLPEGYAAPCLAEVLAMTENLTKRPYRRLLGVLQMIVNVFARDGFLPEGKAVMTIPKIRLLHSRVRAYVRKYRPGYQIEENHGLPVNLEDMLGTVMGFSYLVISGLEILEIELTEKEKEDFFYVWRAFGQMMGIHPAGKPDSTEFMPANLYEAGVFYESYKRRHYRHAAENPDGSLLANANLQMLNDLLPQTPLRRLGLKIVPRIYMEALMGREGCLRVGIKPVRFLYLTKWLLKRLPGIWVRIWKVRDRVKGKNAHHENLSRGFFQDLIIRGLGGEVTFQIPDSFKEL